VSFVNVCTRSCVWRVHSNVISSPPGVEDTGREGSCCSWSVLGRFYCWQSWKFVPRLGKHQQDISWMRLCRPHFLCFLLVLRSQHSYVVPADTLAVSDYSAELLWGLSSNLVCVCESLVLSISKSMRPLLMYFCHLIDENVFLEAAHKIVGTGVTLWLNGPVTTTRDVWTCPWVSRDRVQATTAQKALWWLHLSRHILWLYSNWRISAGCIFQA